jgi:hypothetical protein
MRISLISLLCVLGLAGTATAQQMQSKRFSAPLAGKAVLRDLNDKYSAQVYNMEAPEPDADVEQEKLQEIKSYIAAHYPRKNRHLAAKATAAQPPYIAQAFVADTSSGVPPDNCMAMSVGHKAVSVMNNTIAVLDGLTGQMTSRVNLYNFSIATGLINTITNHNNYRYDPKIIYDPEADRYICIMLNGINEYNWVIIGFTQTNDPEGAWNFYIFKGDYAGDNTWFDYPAIAITHNELFFTGNKIGYNQSWQEGFHRSLIYQVNKQQGYNGDTAITYRIWDSVTNNGNFIRNLYPVKGGASIHGPEQYFLSNRNFDVQNDSIFLIKVPDTIGSQDSTLTVTALQSDLSYGVPPSARQKPPSDSLATNDGRILGAYIEGSEIQFVSASLDPANGASAIYHGKISNVTTNPTVHAEMFTIDTLDLGYPELSYAGGANTSIISFNYSGANTFAGMGAIYYDGSQYSPMLTVKSGDSVIGGPSGTKRWGDYTGSQVDWNLAGAVWVEGIYGRSNMHYGNYMARLNAPTLTSVQQGEKEQANVKLYPNPAWQFISAEFTTTEEQPVKFAIYDMQGRLVDNMLDTWCKPGRNLVQFNIAPLAPGTYFVKGIGSKGKVLLTSTFTRQ